MLIKDISRMLSNFDQFYNTYDDMIKQTQRAIEKLKSMIKNNLPASENTIASAKISPVLDTSVSVVSGS